MSRPFHHYLRKVDYFCRMEPIRKIIHIDMDAFYASIKQRDNPELKGKPVAVGHAEKRGGRSCSQL